MAGKSNETGMEVRSTHACFGGQMGFYAHRSEATGTSMRFAVFVRKGEERYDEVNRVPEQLRLRTLAVRSFDAEAMMVERELVDGRELEGAIARLFADPRAAYLHVHFAAPGCYAARVDRA